MGYLYCCIVGTGRQQTADSLAGYTRVSKDGKLGAFIRALRAWEGSGGGGVPPPLQIERFGSVKDPGTFLLP